MAWPQTVRKDDLRLEYYKGSGAGGQKRNKTSSAVRITHLPTGIQASSEEGRSQSKNKETAFLKLCDKLVPIMKKEEKLSRYRATSETIRTYHRPRNQVTDHRVSKSFEYSEVLEGNGLSDILDSLARKELEA